MRKVRALATVTAGALIVVLLVFAVGCNGGGSREQGRGPEDGPASTEERDIPLQTLAQGPVCDYGRFDEAPTLQDTVPECLVIEDAEGLKRLLYLANLELPHQELDFAENVVIAAMQGPRNTSGYAISIQSLRQSGTDVLVLLELVEPDPGGVTAQMLTSPYHLVIARRSDFQPRGELRFTFQDSKGRKLGTVYADI